MVDPMGEYAPLVKAGRSGDRDCPDSPHHLNPMDVELNMAAGESPLSMKADFLCPYASWWSAARKACSPLKRRSLTAVCVWCTGNRRSD